MLKTVWKWLISPRGKSETKPGHILIWWESRRMAYNLIVGFVGVITTPIFMFMLAHTEHLRFGDAFEPEAILGAAIGFNILYTLCWILEILLQVTKLQSVKVSPVLYVAITTFSAIVVCLPCLYEAHSYFMK